MNIIDARGLSCPQPVILAKQALDQHPQNLQIIVDNHVAMENVSRLASHLGYTITEDERSLDIYLTLQKER